jgi:mono/diheme cytochrome c family protein
MFLGIAARTGRTRKDHMKIKSVIVGIAAAIIVAGGYGAFAKGPPEHPGDTETGPPFDLKDATRIEAGKGRFESTCAAFCHGNPPPLFVGRTDLDPQYVYNTIRDGGRGATPMPPWGDVFTPEEIWELVAYVESLGSSPSDQ